LPIDKLLSFLTGISITVAWHMTVSRYFYSYAHTVQLNSVFGGEITMNIERRDFAVIFPMSSISYRDFACDYFTVIFCE